MSQIRIIVIVLTLMSTAPSLAGWAPTIVQNAFKKLYPSVEVVGWSTDRTYYVAGFQHNGFNMKVWFDTKGNWQMKQTDWQNLDEVPMAVYHTFTFGNYSSDNVLDVTYVEFPQRQAQIVIRIGIDNEATQYQLFYFPDGELINARNVTNMYNILGASTFL